MSPELKESPDSVPPTGAGGAARERAPIRHPSGRRGRRPPPWQSPRRSSYEQLHGGTLQRHNFRRRMRCGRAIQPVPYSRTSRRALRCLKTKPRLMPSRTPFREAFGGSSPLEEGGRIARISASSIDRSRQSINHWRHLPRASGQRPYFPQAGRLPAAKADFALWAAGHARADASAPASAGAASASWRPPCADGQHHFPQEDRIILLTHAAAFEAEAERLEQHSKG